MGRRLLISCLIPIAFAACSPEAQSTPAPRAGVVARVDSTLISAGELRDFVLHIPPGLRSNKKGDEARREYVRSLVAKYVLQLEAEARKLDTVRAVQARLASSWHQHLVSIYRREALSGRVEVPEEAIRRYYEEEKLGRQRQMAGILVDEKARAQEVLKKLAAGERFEDLAAEYSVDKRSTSQGGLLGFVTLPQARKLNVPDELFRSLPTGAVSPVLPMGRRYQVVRFLQDRTVPLQTEHPRIQALLSERRRDEREREKIQSLARELEWKLEPQTLNLLLKKAAAQSGVRRRQFSPQEAARPLFTYRGGEIALGDYIEALWRDPMRARTGWGVRDSLEVLEAAGEILLGPTMLLEAARRAGIGQRPQEQRWRQRMRREFMVEQLRRQEAVDKAVVHTEEAEDFYQKHEEIFRRDEEFYLVEVLVETRAKAAELFGKLEEGETISSLAQQYSIRPRMREEAGMLHLGARERLTRPQLYQAAQEAELNQIVGPVQVKGGYSLFKVLHRQGGDIRPFSEAERRARAFVHLHKKNRLFEDLIETMLKKYARRTAVYQQELAAALPDSFLQQLETKKPSPKQEL